MQSKRIAIVNRTAPHGTSHGQEALDMAMVAGTFGQEVGLFFIDDGVFQLVKDQHPEAALRKNYSKTFAALEFYDIDTLLVCQQSLLARGLTEADLCVPVDVLSPDTLQSTLAHFDHIVSF
ncbi:sulfurtransferase complex subunit TusC [Bowmanella sp. Y26]|uniref:sulfurtransferase complex subunit TusC n=1 Tax=Bowmanella yangjiangensis TaxID=2811230 RepID=UPI001BDC3A03|nr:sulfurtransferase complex subunit TusC [Bowmanella yangjiangensis]MBT1063805.1 sulfurtransferase complex subunit TusC [Bowmanella yangjiangensis]